MTVGSEWERVTVGNERKERVEWNEWNEWNGRNKKGVKKRKGKAVIEPLK